MSEPCENCDRMDCPTFDSPRPGTGDWMGASADCRSHTVNWRDRAIAAEKQLATLAESGTGYSQQTVDAIVRERDALRGIVARVSAWAVAYGNGADLYHPAVADTMRHASNKVTFLLNDKETP